VHANVPLEIPVSSRDSSPGSDDLRPASAKCGGGGYKGRCGLHELLIASDPLKKLIAERSRVSDLIATALEEGMRTLKQDGMEKCLLGMTSMKEVRSVCIK